MLCYLLSIYCTCPKRQLWISFVTKGKAVTTTAAKSIYNDVQLSQETFHEEYRYPHSESPTFAIESNHVAICYYLFDEGRVLHLTILYKYYTLIFKIRLHLLHLRLDSDAVLSSLAALHVSEA